jgi:hypothetical protein
VSDAVTEILAGLAPYPHGWRGLLPPAIGTFLGLPLGLHLETRSVRGDDPPPQPLAEEIELLGVVLTGWPQVVERAEQEFAQHTRRDRTATKHAFEPQVEILRDDAEDNPGAGRWSLRVGRSDRPGFAYHIEFERLAFREVWSGD